MAALGYAPIRYYGREKKAQAFQTHLDTLIPAVGYAPERPLVDPHLGSLRRHSDVVIVSLNDTFDAKFPIGLFEPTSQAEPDGAEELREQFEQLRDEWAEASALVGSPMSMFMHRAYQRIIGMGPQVLPLIFESLTDSPDHWFWALAAITGEDPAEGLTSFKKARLAWLAWAEEQGHLG